MRSRSSGRSSNLEICSEYWDTTGTLDHIFCNSLYGRRMDAQRAATAFRRNRDFLSFQTDQERDSPYIFIGECSEIE